MSNRATAPSFSASGSGSLRRGAGAAAINQTFINVEGGLDSADTIARRIEKLLADRARRTGTTRTGVGARVP